MRVKRGKTTHAKHKRLMTQTKGYSRGSRSSVKLAKQAVLKALSYGDRDRRNRTRDFRRLWITRINAGLDDLGISYSLFMNQLKSSGIELDRKILSELATNHSDVFKHVVEQSRSKH